MKQFSIRDIFWLTAVIAALCGGWILGMKRGIQEGLDRGIHEAIKGIMRDLNARKTAPPNLSDESQKQLDRILKTYGGPGPVEWPPDRLRKTSESHR